MSGRSQLTHEARIPRQRLAGVDDFGWWCVVPAAELRTPEDVELFVLTPLLRFAVGDLPEVRIEAGEQPGTLMVGDEHRPLCAVTVTQRVRRGRDWSDCPVFREAVAFANSLGCPAMLVDALDVYLIEYGADRPRKILPRSTFTSSAFAVVRDHVLAAELV